MKKTITLITEDGQYATEEIEIEEDNDGAREYELACMGF